MRDFFYSPIYLRTMPDNYAIADQFSLLSKLMDIHQENSFKSKSYANAAFNIEKLPSPLESIPRNEIASLKGIGESTAKKIHEILDTGKLTALDELIEKTPPGILEMMQIKGLGPKKISTIWKEMGIETIGELLYACNENRLLLYKGFGEKTQKNVADAIGFFLKHQGHFLYAEIEEYALHLKEVLIATFPENNWAMAGAFARQIPTIETLTILTDASPDQFKEFMQENSFEEVNTDGSKNTFKGQEQINIEIISVKKEDFVTEQFKLNASQAFVDAWKKTSLASSIT